MLNTIRKHTSSWVIKALFVFLILSFAIWGIGDMITGRISGRGVAKVGDTDITAESLRAAFTRDYERLREALGAQIDHERALALGVHRSSLESLIQDALIADEARSLGLVTTDDMVRAEVRNTSVFHNALGQFDPEIYRNVLLRNGLNERDYLRSVRAGLVRQILTGSLIQGARVPDAILDPLFRFRFERRIADTAFVSFASARGRETPPPEEIEQFYKTHTAQFMAPEYRAFTSVSFTADQLARETDVSEQNLKDAYASRANEFASPERRTVRQMTFDSREDAQKAVNQLAADATLDTVAKNLLNADPESLNLGAMSRGDLLPELVDAVFGLAVGKISQPVQSPLAWHVLTVTAIQPASTPTLADVRDDLRREIAREQAVDRVFKMANNLEDSLAGGATLEETSLSLGLRVVTVDSVDATGRRPAGEAVQDMPYATRLLDVAFTTEEGRESPLSELPDDGYLVVRVDKITPPAPRQLNDVRDAVIDEWRNEQAKIAARAQAQDLLERIKAGASPAKAAEALGEKHGTTLPFTRDGSGTDLPAALVGKLFSAAPGEAILAEGPSGMHVARLKQIVAADPIADKAQSERLHSAIAEQMQGDIFVVTLNALRAEHPVRIDEGMIRQLFPTSPL